MPLRFLFGLFIGTFFVFLIFLPFQHNQACAPGTSMVPIADLPQSFSMPWNGRTSPLDEEQIYHAAVVNNAALEIEELEARDQIIAIMIAFGESSLRNIDKGDQAGPDSRGLFQGRADGGMGFYADRMDPRRAALHYYHRSIDTFSRLTSSSRRQGGRVPSTNKQEMPPTWVAHITQRNADVNHYTRSWQGAVSLWEAITNTTYIHDGPPYYSSNQQAQQAGTYPHGSPNDPYIPHHIEGMGLKNTSRNDAYSRTAQGGTDNWGFQDTPPYHGLASLQACTSNNPINHHVSDSGTYIMPVHGARLTSPYGIRIHPITRQSRMHHGQDFGIHAGAPIYASRSGTVRSAGHQGGYGLIVIIDHGQGHETRYAHQSRLKVSAGMTVQQGDIIGLVGSTGVSTGPHLHFEIRINGKSTNPMPYLQGK